MIIIWGSLANYYQFLGPHVGCFSIAQFFRYILPNIIFIWWICWIKMIYKKTLDAFFTWFYLDVCNLSKNVNFYLPKSPFRVTKSQEWIKFQSGMHLICFKNSVQKAEFQNVFLFMLTWGIRLFLGKKNEYVKVL